MLLACVRIIFVCLFIGMVRTYSKKTTCGQTYSKELLAQAVLAVKNGMKLKTAAHEFKIPRSTIRRHGQRTVQKHGGQTVLSKDQEQQLFNRVIYMCDRGFPCTINDLRQTTYLFAKHLYRQKKIASFPHAWKAEKKASYDWWYGFQKRFPKLSIRVAENLSVGRAEAFNKERIDAFFNEAYKVLVDNDVLTFPNLIYNCDETGLSSVPNTSLKVLAEKGTKCVQKIQVGERGSLTTLLACGNATGDYLPPFLIFKGGISPSQENYPPGTRIFTSKSGYIDKELFLEFLRHFQEHRVKIEGKKAILFLDGHGSHLCIESIEYAINNKIEMICLPPHSSHRLQPLDTHFNGPLKKIWSSEVSTYLSENSQVILTKANFGDVFSKVWTSISTRRGLLVDGFAYCGLYPLKNPTCEQDFVKTSFFSQSSKIQKPVTNSESQPTWIAVRAVIPSPNKFANPAHKRPHTAQITSPENYESKRLKHSYTPVSASVKAGASSASTSRSTEAATSSRSKLKGEATSSRKNKTKFSQKYRQSNVFNRASRKKVNESSSNSTTCCVCDAQYIESTDDWFQCTACGNWACEDCFGTNTCANC
jgi:hypothetical protein